MDPLCPDPHLFVVGPAMQSSHALMLALHNQASVHYPGRLVHMHTTGLTNPEAALKLVHHPAPTSRNGHLQGLGLHYGTVGLDEATACLKGEGRRQAQGVQRQGPRVAGIRVRHLQGAGVQAGDHPVWSSLLHRLPPDSGMTPYHTICSFTWQHALDRA